MLSKLVDELNRLKAVESKQYFIFAVKNIVLIGLLANAEFFLYWLSTFFTVYEGWVSWYWPVGLRTACLLLFPFRYWPALLIAGSSGQLLFNVLINDGVFVTSFERILGSTFSLFSLSKVVVIGYVKIKVKDVNINSLKSLLMVLGAAVSYRMISSSILILTNRLYETIPDERKFEIILAHFLGGVLAILIIVPLAFLIQYSWRHRDNICVFNTKWPLGALVLLVVTTVFIYSIQPHTLYLLRILSFIPLVWFGYRFGWAGAIVSSLVINALIIVSVFNVNDTQILIENMLYIISVALIGALIGALMSEQKLVTLKLSENNDRLVLNNAELLMMANKNQELSEKLMIVQEEERRSLSNELHDEVGQNITALKIELRVLELKFKDYVNDAPLARLHAGADQIYDSIYRVMHRLRPRVLDDLGLRESLKGSYFRDTLKSSGINYHCSIDGDINGFDERLKITIFRICQESITNCIRHSNAKNCWLALSVKEGELSLCIVDDGDGLLQQDKSSSKGGFGLIGIEERVHSLNGYYQIASDSNGTEIKVTIPRYFDDRGEAIN